VRRSAHLLLLHNPDNIIIITVNFINQNHDNRHLHPDRLFEALVIAGIAPLADIVLIVNNRNIKQFKNRSSVKKYVREFSLEGAHDYDEFFEGGCEEI
jgi:hypothetical protein